jgi:hypothetical protein
MMVRLDLVLWAGPLVVWAGLHARRLIFFLVQDLCLAGSHCAASHKQDADDCPSSQITEKPRLGNELRQHCSLPPRSKHHISGIAARRQPAQGKAPPATQAP